MQPPSPARSCLLSVTIINGVCFQRSTQLGRSAAAFMLQSVLSLQGAEAACLDTVPWVSQPQSSLPAPYALPCPWGAPLHPQPPRLQTGQRDQQKQQQPHPCPASPQGCSGLARAGHGLHQCPSHPAVLGSWGSPVGVPPAMSGAVTYRPPAPRSGAAAGLPSDCGRCSGRSRRACGPAR